MISKDDAKMMHETIVVELFMPRKKQEHTTPETPGQRLARIRKERGLTQEELAEHLNVTQTAVSDYENDVVRLHGMVITKLTDILHVSADEILGLKKTKTNGQIIRRTVLKRIQQIEKLPKRDQQALFRTIDAYLRQAS